MTELFFILLRILFPLDPIRQAKEAARNLLGAIVRQIETDDSFLDLVTLPEARLQLEAAISFAEDAVRILVEQRARQILNLPHFQPRAASIRRPRRARDLDDLCARLQRAIALFDDLGRLAHRRADQLQRERTENPLGISPTFTTLAPPLLRFSSLIAHDALLRPSTAKARGSAHARAPPHKMSLPDSKAPE